MTTAAAILAVFLDFPSYGADKHESLEERITLYLPTVEAIASVARTQEEAAVLISIAEHESHLARYVLEGRCSEGPPGQRCDGGRARGPFQVHGHCKAGDLAGEARCALGQYLWGARRCQSAAGGFAALGGRGACFWAGSATRVAMTEKARGLLADAEKRIQRNERLAAE